MSSGKINPNPNPNPNPGEESALPSAASHLPSLDAAPTLQYSVAGAEAEIAQLPVYSHRQRLLDHIAANRVTCLQGVLPTPTALPAKSRVCSLLSPDPNPTLTLTLTLTLALTLTHSHPRHSASL